MSKTRKEDVENLQAMLDNEGFGYYFMDYTDTHIPEIQKEADAFREAGRKLEKKLNELYEKFEIEEY